MNKLYTEAEPVAWVTADTVDGQVVNGKPRRIWWENNEGVGMPIYGTTQPTEQQPAPDVSALVEALEEIIHPVRFMQERLEEGERLNGMAAVQLAEDASYLRDIAIAALAAHRKQGGDV